MDGLHIDDDCLLRAIAQNNEWAFTKLFYAHKDKVYTIAMMFTKNETDAEEIVQEVFSRIWKYREKLPEIKNFSAWIATVTKHRALTALQKIARERAERQQLYTLSENQTLLDADYNLKEVQSLLQTALQLLTPQQRKVFELTRINGLDRKTVAASLGLSPATVSVHLTIALRRVRSFLYEHSYEIVLLVVFSFLQ
ncbi:RNA polymerase sigma-70 factor, ECF subfamily [Arachidicoccus rhizosphaerae]|uniref:RNA polymerase sigma-70 factor, ECF subfamily n=1 Tax=Arachidicoccus rhizosphaerae TaxID=551991 RepID=A0A1H4AYD7_9BACT|nr:sigma-70 family RNA polymerase sigma factor [Arachidicoccus rhizosphaerae]SEA40866.1 RNA polymerase sigma-70 factor, ECF subfamily [Arachidicoccus rhizosphaerae]